MLTAGTDERADRQIRKALIPTQIETKAYRL